MEDRLAVVAQLVGVLARFLLENIMRVTNFFLFNNGEENTAAEEMEIGEFIFKIKTQMEYPDIVDEALDELESADDRHVMMKKLNSYLVHILSFRHTSNSVFFDARRALLNYQRYGNNNNEPSLIEQQAKNNLESVDNYYNSIDIPRHVEPEEPELVSLEKQMAMMLNSSATNAGPPKVIHKKKEEKKSDRSNNERTDASRPSSSRSYQSRPSTSSSHYGNNSEFMPRASNVSSCSSGPSGFENYPKQMSKVSRYPSSSWRQEEEEEFEYSSMEEASDTESPSMEDKRKAEKIRKQFDFTTERNSDNSKSVYQSHEHHQPRATTSIRTDFTSIKLPDGPPQKENSSDSFTDITPASSSSLTGSSSNNIYQQVSERRAPTDSFPKKFLQRPQISTEETHQEPQSQNIVRPKPASKRLDPFAKAFIPNSSRNTASSSHHMLDTRLQSERISLCPSTSQLVEPPYRSILNVYNDNILATPNHFVTSNRSENSPSFCDIEKQSNIVYLLKEEATDKIIGRCAACRDPVYDNHETFQCNRCLHLHHANCSMNNPTRKPLCVLCNKSKREKPNFK
uniref:Phorbol-ester/DAG-type domain-containing protein n=1 Tax=Caenorhabditis tropicalis TaxID=1561998 RepID=A0A1I7TYP1_9PELO